MFLPRLDIVILLLSLPAFVLAITVHEYAHAWVANRMGDPTARLSGRMTLEPWAHLDLIGTLMLVVFRFGWAKPVPINPRNFRDPRRGILYTSLAGPFANFALAIVTVIVLYFGYPLWQSIPHLPEVLDYIFVLNVFFGVFNLIPIPPLDGAKVLMAILPGRQAYAFSRIEPYGPIILILFLFTGAGDVVIGGLGRAIISGIVAVVNLLGGLLGIGV